MLDDLVPIVVDLPQEDIVIYPISDIHYGSPQFRFKEWARFRQKIIENPNAYVVIAGDAINNALKTSVSNVYEETCRPADQKRWLAEELKPIKDKILCGCGGNHERRSLKDSDDDPLYDVFSKLDIEDRYRENACFLILRINYCAANRCTSERRPTYNICVTHGSGGGMYIGSSANKVERFGGMIDNLDVIITGHTHKPITFPSAKLYIDNQNKRVTVKQFVCIVATSWLDYGGYPIQKMLVPTAFIEQELHLSGKGKHIKVVSSSAGL